MKSPCLALLAAVSVSFATDIRYGGHLESLLGQPSVNSDFDSKGKIGFGGAAGVGARVGLSETFSIRPALGFALVQHGSEFDIATDEGAHTITNTFTSKFLVVETSLEYAPIPQLRLQVTPEYDVSLGGTVKTETNKGDVSSNTPTVASTEDGSGSMDITDESNPFSLGLGAGYAMGEHIVVAAAYKLALTDYFEDSYTLNQVSLRLRYEL